MNLAAVSDQYMGHRYFPNPQKKREEKEVANPFEGVVNPWEKPMDSDLDRPAPEDD